MAVPKTMNRVIHAAVRRDLDRLDAALGAVRTEDSARAAQLELAYANLHRELQHHHQSEDQFIYPFVAEVSPAPELLRTMDEEHHAMAEALASTHEAMSAFAATGTPAAAEQAQGSVARTRDVVEQHLAHEERDFEPLVDPFLETDEWKAVEQQTRSASAREGGEFFAWLQDGISDENRTYLRSAVPPPVLYLLTNLAGRRYRRIAATWK